jgi:hypothetical protein
MRHRQRPEKCMLLRVAGRGRGRVPRDAALPVSAPGRWRSAANHLIHAGYLAATTLGSVSPRVAAALTPAGHAVLDTNALAS